MLLKPTSTSVAVALLALGAASAIPVDRCSEPMLEEIRKEGEGHRIHVRSFGLDRRSASFDDPAVQPKLVKVAKIQPPFDGPIRERSYDDQKDFGLERRQKEAGEHERHQHEHHLEHPKGHKHSTSIGHAEGRHHHKHKNHSRHTLHHENMPLSSSLLRRGDGESVSSKQADEDPTATQLQKPNASRVHTSPNPQQRLYTRKRPGQSQAHSQDGTSGRWQETRRRSLEDLE
ncbi:hypothetical protein CALCODRAFT_483063 [Calocera cornea HHB12733]|uniref:Uncharacterized protein n=1 Tax=Calocera cornea HHB12733 TaxID=1353952 RepID=A0A165G557_9BASI|nr:hypothetical protein CALCODRAFT_483063 [Calocera cornea HHB12733]